MRAAAAPTGGTLRRDRPAGIGGPVGLLVLALGGLAAGSLTGRPAVAAGLGLAVGLLLVVGPWPADVALGLIGAAASAQVALQVLGGSGCWGQGAVTRWVTVGLVGAVFAVTFLVGRHLPGNRRSTSLATAGLGLFAVLDVMVFLVSPLGVPITVSGPGAVGVSAFAAAAFGLGSGFAPVLGPLLLGTAVAIVGAGLPVLVGQPCAGAPAEQAVVAALAFTAVAGAAAMATRHGGVVRP